MAGEWCRRCGDYSVWGACACKLIGNIWKADDDESESQQLWSIHGAYLDIAVADWVKHQHSRDFEFIGPDQTIAFAVRLADGGGVQYVAASAELTISVRARHVDKDDDDVLAARRSRARTLRWRRRRARETTTT